MLTTSKYRKQTIVITILFAVFSLAIFVFVGKETRAIVYPIGVIVLALTVLLLSVRYYRYGEGRKVS